MGKSGNPKWKKGISGNPGGRIKLPQDVKEAKRLNQLEIDRVLNRFLQYKREELRTVKDNPESSTLELLIGSIITNAINKGDHMRFNFILDRLIGKSLDRIEISRPFENISSEELLAKLPEAIEAVKLGVK